MSDLILSVDGVSKKYNRTGGVGEAHSTLKGIMENVFLRRLGIAPKKESERRDFWALKDVNFSLRRGEVLGIIGRNGAGKSTLLKIISRLTAPTSGSVRLLGSIGSYLGMGVGMHQELTGRENIALSGSLLGMQTKGIAEKAEEIIDFSEIRDAIDMPVKFYSSGMRARLAFSIAAHLDCKDILVIDEALAAGDIAFCTKCLAKISSLVSQGQTALFVSHSMGHIRRLSTHCLYLQEGSVAAYGDTNDVVGRYVRDMEALQAPQPAAAAV